MGWLFGDASEKMFRNSFREDQKISGEQAAADAKIARRQEKAAKGHPKKGKNKK